MNTTPMGLPRFARVVRSISSPPALSSVTSTSGPLLAGARGRVDELVAGDDDVALEHHLVAVLVHRRSSRRSARGRSAGIGPRIDQPVFERRDLAEHVLHFRGVLHAGQLHDDAIEALALHDGLGDAELVDAIAQRGDVLR